MEAVVGLVLLLLRVVHGVHFSCDGRQDGAQCFGAEGGTVDIQLLNNVVGITRIQLNKGNSVIPLWNNNAVVNTIDSRYVFSPRNGTFTINNLNKTDSGEYNLQLYKSEGKLTGNRTLHLTVKEQSSSLRIGTFSALAVFIVCIIVICVLRRKHKRKEEGDDTELTYADVRMVLQPARRPLKQRVEETVEYGEIRSTR